VQNLQNLLIRAIGSDLRIQAQLPNPKASEGETNGAIVLPRWGYGSINCLAPFCSMTMPSGAMFPVKASSGLGLGWYWRFVAEDAKQHVFPGSHIALLQQVESV
ncbi:MAG: hypothetical protein WAN62_04110, partial [Candidatus Acidiferrum sp.]